MGFFSQTLFSRNRIKKNHEDIETRVQKLIGHVVICEDMVFRRVYNAVAGPANSQAARNGYIIINEGDPLEPLGHWVSILAMERAIHGDPPPTKVELDAFKRIAQNIKTVNLKEIHNQHKQGKLKLDFND